MKRTLCLVSFVVLIPLLALAETPLDQLFNQTITLSDDFSSLCRRALGHFHSWSASRVNTLRWVERYREGAEYRLRDLEFSEIPISHTLWANLHFHEVYEVPEGAKLEAVRSFSDLLSNGYQQRMDGATVVEITENHHAIATDANAYERMLIDRSAINTRPHEVGQFIVQDGSQQRWSPLIHGQAGHLQIPATMQTEILDRLLPKSETGTERELTLHLYHTHPVPEFIIHHLNVIEERFRRRGRTNRQVVLFPVSAEDIELAQAISQTYPRVRVIIHATTPAGITYSVGFQNGNPIRI